MSVMGQVGGGEGHRYYQPATLLSWKQVLTSPGMLGPATLRLAKLAPNASFPKGSPAVTSWAAGQGAKCPWSRWSWECHQQLPPDPAQQGPASPGGEAMLGNARAGHYFFSGSLLALGQGEGLDARVFARQPGRRASFQMGWGRDCPLGLEPLTLHQGLCQAPGCSWLVL